MEVLLKLAWTKHSRALSVLSLPPFPEHSYSMPRICSPAFSSRMCHLLGAVPALHSGGLEWFLLGSLFRNSMILSPFPSLQPVFVCPLTIVTHKTCIRLGNWFNLCLTRTSLEPTEMGMQIVAEFCVVLLPLSCAF